MNHNKEARAKRAFTMFAMILLTLTMTVTPAFAADDRWQ